MRALCWGLFSGSSKTGALSPTTNAATEVDSGVINSMGVPVFRKKRRQSLTKVSQIEFRKVVLKNESGVAVCTILKKM
jgi:hypothetical protein